MKIILLQCGRDYETNSFGFTDGLDQTWINHGLASIGAYIKKFNFTFDFLDMRTIKSRNHFIKHITKTHPDLVAISAMASNYDFAKACIRDIKNALPSVKTVIGGIHATICSKEIYQDNAFDYIVLGEGEKALMKIVKNDAHKGIIREEPVENIDEIPSIERNFFGASEYPVYPPLFPRPFATFIATRGCPFRCNYCQPALAFHFGNKIRSRSAKNLVEEISKTRKDFAIRSYMLHDDCNLTDVDWIQDFIFHLGVNKIKMPFAIQARADIIARNPELITALATRGLTMLQIGFESGSQKILDFLKKNTTVEQNLRAAQICRNNSITIWANYMLGFPGETKQDVADTISMIHKIRPTVHSPTFFTPSPGTDLFDYCRKKELLLEHRTYRRNPDGEKIKGVDYGYLKKVLDSATSAVNKRSGLMDRIRSIFG